MRRKVLVDMAGVRYGRLVGLSLSHRGPSGHAQWLFSCDCGGRIVTDGSRVRSGKATSCGCRHREISAARLTVHGHRAAKRHGPTYRAWQAMKDACTNPASPRYGAVGARGIEVCAAWSADYRGFLRDMGERPAGTSLDRRDPARGFAPDNCAWTPTPSRSVRACRGWGTRRAGGERLAENGASRPEDGPTRGRASRGEARVSERADGPRA